MPIDKMNPAAAASAYANIQKVADSGGIAAPDGPSFGDIMKNGLVSAIDTMKGGEQAAATAVTGKGDLTTVVQAMTDAEMTLDEVVAIRDKMQMAYDKIMQMPI